MAKIATLNVNVTSSTAEFEKGLDRAKKRADTFSSSFMESFAGAFSGNIAAEAFTKTLDVAGNVARTLEQWTVDVVNTANAASRLADEFNVPVDQIMAFSRVTKDVNDSDLSQFQDSIKKMVKTLGEASSGGKDTAAMFDRVGLSVDRVLGQNPIEQFLMIADAISKVESPAERAAAAIAIFGKSGQDMLPVITRGRRALEDMAQKQVEMGAAINNVDAGKLSEVDDALDSIEDKIEGIKNRIVLGLSPAIIASGDYALGLLDKWFPRQFEHETLHLEQVAKAHNYAGEVAKQFEDMQKQVSTALDTARMDIRRFVEGDQGAMVSKLSDQIAQGKAQLETAAKAIGAPGGVKGTDFIQQMTARVDEGKKKLKEMDDRLVSLHRQLYAKDPEIDKAIGNFGLAPEEYKNRVNAALDKLLPVEKEFNSLTKERAGLLAKVNELQDNLGHADAVAKMQEGIAATESNLEQLRQAYKTINEERQRGAAIDSFNSAARLRESVGLSEIERQIVDLAKSRDKALGSIAFSFPTSVSDAISKLDSIASNGITAAIDSASITMLKDAQKTMDNVQLQKEHTDAAARIIDSLKTPEDRLADFVKTLDDLLAEHLLSQDQYNKALQDMSDKMTPKFDQPSDRLAGALESRTKRYASGSPTGSQVSLLDRRQQEQITQLKNVVKGVENLNRSLSDKDIRTVEIN